MSVATKRDVFELLEKHRQMLRSLGVRRVGLFGSFVHDHADTNSDVDLLVEFSPGCKTFDNFMELSLNLEDLLQRRVELVTLESLNSRLATNILKEVEYAGIAA